MGRIIRVTTNWTGFVGSPGFTNLYFEPTVEGDPFTQPLVDAAVTKVATWLTAQRPYLPVPVTTGIDPSVAELDEQNGEIQQYWTATPPAPAAGTQAFSFSGASGYCISWSTAGVRRGRRVRGRTFVVPTSSSAYAADGTIDTTALNSFKAAAVTLATDSNGVRLVVWARPTKGALIPDGGAYDVVTSDVKDKVAILTSRRD